MSTTINNTILSVTRRTKKGFTVGEIFDRVVNRYVSKGLNPPLYNSVRARVSELARRGRLTSLPARPDVDSGRMSTTFVRG